MLNIDLFENIIEPDVMQLLQCFGIKTKSYKKGAYIIHTNDVITSFAIILEGRAQIVKEISDGKEIVLEKLSVNSIFCHDIICGEIKKSPVSVIASSECEILFLPYKKLITPCNKLCKYHLQLIKNIIKMISMKNTVLNNKIDIIGQKSIREKILMLLKKYSKNSEQNAFTIPFSREEMAKYICSDRCAISRELSKMRDEGILKFYKNNFQFLKKI